MTFKASAIYLTKYRSDAAARPVEVYAIYEDEKMICYSPDKHDVLPIIKELNNGPRKTHSEHQPS